MAHRKAAIQVSNQTGVPLLSGAICRECRDNYRIECAWEALPDGETTRVAYRGRRTGKDCRVITWIDAKGGIYVARAPEGMAGLGTVILRPDSVLCASESRPAQLRAGTLRWQPALIRLSAP